MWEAEVLTGVKQRGAGGGGGGGGGGGEKTSNLIRSNVGLVAYDKQMVPGSKL